MAPSPSQVVLLCLTQALLCTAVIDTGSFLIYNKDHNKCVVAVSPTVVHMAPCNPSAKNQNFRWASQSRLLSLSEKLCLGAQELKDWVKVLLFPCDEKSLLQQWECKNETLFGLKGQNLHFNYGNNNERNVMVYQGSGSWSRWIMYSTQSDLCSKGYQEIFTLGGNAFGKPCQFPFKFGEKWFAECSIEGRADGQLWCGTETDYNKEKKWGFCPSKSSSGWDSDPVTGVLYQRNTQSVLTWYQARVSCQQQGADLLSIVELHEQTYISGLTNVLGIPLWIGLNSLDFDSGWQWSNGNPFRYLNWAPGHPSTEPGLNCAVLHAGKASKWESMECSKKLGYMCRKGNSTVLPPPPIDQPSYCPNYWVSYAGHCYFLERTKRMWRDALAACHKEGGDLASIHNIEEQSFILSQSGYLATDELWIGLNDQRSQNLFEWSDRSHVTFAQWQTGEPSHGTNLQEDCVLIRGKDGKWVDHMCEKTHGYICKKKASIKLPEGATEEVISGCKAGWIRFGVHCYKIGSETKTFEEAKTDCQESESNLVDVADRYENAFLISLVGLRPEKYFWTGLSNMVDIETFSWTKETTVTFTHFNVGMPARKQGCVAMTTGMFAGLWDVISCDRKEKYICKKMAEGVTTTAVPPTTVAPTCPRGWTSLINSNYCFKVYSMSALLKRTWFEAREFCKAVGGELLSLKSGQTSNLPFYIDPSWIGLSAQDPNAGFTWSDGTPLSIEDWDFGEPNNYNDNEYCVEAHSNIVGKMRWNDRNCESYNDWICQIRKGVVPKPEKFKVAEEYNTTADGWVEFNDTQYFVNTDEMPMADAREFCKKKHGDLATITGNSERRLLWKMIAKKSRSQYYIGMIVNLDKSFSWLDGTPVSYTAWDQNEPNFANNDENCVSIYKNLGHWNDINCGVDLPSICKRSSTFINTTIAPTTVPIGGCAPEWILFNGKCYQFNGVNNKKTWHDARDYCIKHGGNLASVFSQKEQDFITVQMAGHPCDMWLGLNDVNWEMRFLWTEGRKVTYVNWAKGHPTMVPDGRYSFEGEFDCVVTVGSNARQAGFWKVEDCTGTQGFLCKRDIDSQIAPLATTVSTKNFVKLGNDSYKLVAQKMKWDEARRQCQADDADLASILNPVTQAFSSLLIHKYGEPVWIGLNNNLTQGRFQWVDNWRLSFTKWGKNEPKMNQGCVYIDIDGLWKTGPCSDTYYSLCKVSQEVAPTQPPQLPGNCPEPKRRRTWLPFRGHCYSFNYAVVDNWAHASVECVRMGGSLVSIEDPVENQFITETIDLLQDDAKSFWIGLHKSYQGQWMWINNDVLDYTNWKQGSPSSDDCVEIRSDTGKWNSYSCMRYKSYICKTPKVIVPTEKVPIIASSVEDAPHGYAGIAVAVSLLIITVVGLVFFLFRKRIPTPVLGESTFDNRLYFNSDPSRPITTVDTKGLVANIEQNEQA